MTNPQFLAIANALGWTLVHSLWQIALVAVLLRGLLLLSSNQSARLRYGLSLASMLVIALGSMLTFYWNYHPIVTTLATGKLVDLGLTNLPFEGITNNELKATLWEVGLARLEQSLPYLTVAWLIGIFVTSISTAQGYFQLRRLQSQHSQPVSEAWQGRLRELQARLGIQKKVELFTTSLLSEPITFRHFKPVILLPASLLSGLTTEQIEVLLLHELAHIRRYDYLVNWMQSCLEVLFFYHPAFWWISRQLRAEREHCCDDLVMRVVQQPMLYAQTLTQLQLNFHSLKTNLAMSATKNQGVFTTRIHRLFGKYSIPTRPPRGAILALLLAVSVVAWAFYAPTKLEPKPSSEQQILQHQDSIPRIYSNGELSKIGDLEKVEQKCEDAEIAIYEAKNPNIQAGFYFFNENNDLIHSDLLEEEEADRRMDAGQFVFVTNPSLKSKANNNSSPQGAKFLHHFFDKSFDENIAKNVEYHEDAVLNEDGNWELNKMKTDTMAIVDGLAFPKTKMRIRTNGIEKDVEPLYILDGKIVTVPIEEAVSSDEINRLQMLTGQEATDKYGIAGKDGVVEIVTLESEQQSNNIFRADKVTLPSSTTPGDFISDSKNEQMLLVANGVVWGNLGNNAASDAKLNELNRQHIETIDIRGGDKAVEQYGEQAANGVVEIRTKMGKQLQGKPAGISINNQHPPSIKLKSTESDTTKQPLFVIDGEIVRDTKLEKIDPDWIETIFVLKGEKALEKYGTQGQNGVVEITMKSYKKYSKDHPPRAMVLNGAIYDNMDTEEESLRHLGLDKLSESDYTKRTFLSPEEGVAKYGKIAKGGIWELYTDDSMLDIEYPKVGLAADKIALGGNPLLVIDGEIIDYGDDISAYIDKNLKARHIKKVNIWKGEDAVERYGEKGKQGVLELFTKKTQADKTPPTEKVEFKFAKTKTKNVLTVSPNPASDVVHLEIRIPKAAKVQLSIFDAQGRVVEHLHGKHFSAKRFSGQASIPWNVAQRPKGIYVAVLSVSGKKITKQFVVQ